jgi:hypothetical protein
VPFQFSVRVCAELAPDGVSYPTAQTLLEALLVVTPVRLSLVPGDGLGTMDHAEPFQCSMSVVLGEPPCSRALPPLPPTAQTSVGLLAVVILRDG